MKTLLALIPLQLFFITHLWALTITGAVDMARQHNPQVARAEALVKASEARTGQAQAPFWPSLGINYSYWQADRDPNLATDDLSSTSSYARYNLFNGGSNWFSLEAAKSRQAAAQWQYQSTVADTVLAVRQAFIEVLRAEKSLVTSRQSLDLLERQHREASLRLEQGLIARNDLLRVAVERATAQQNLVSAEGQLAVARQSLGRTMGKALAPEEQLTPVTFAGQTLAETEALAAQMFESRSELKYLQHKLAAIEADRKAVYGDLLPDVDLSYRYDTFGNRTFPDSSDENYDHDSVTMVQASWTLFEGFDARYELAARKQEIFALKEEIRGTEDLLLVQLSTALQNYRTAKTNLETARTSLELAEENYRVNESRYKAQVATTVDLLDAQEFLTRTRNEELKAQYDLYNAEAVIDRVLERDLRGE